MINSEFQGEGKTIKIRRKSALAISYALYTYEKFWKTRGEKDKI